jgi:hypothetical protein
LGVGVHRTVGSSILARRDFGDASDWHQSQSFHWGWLTKSLGLISQWNKVTEVDKFRSFSVTLFSKSGGSWWHRRKHRLFVSRLKPGPQGCCLLETTWMRLVRCALDANDGSY